jgi:SAM-dependent methyltransferase
MDPSFQARLERVYAQHPVTADAVLERVRRSRGTLEGIRARDLAEAPDGGVTDQNHAGGASADRALAAAVGVGPGWAVLDVGTGLGGTPRLLAEDFGCRAHGVELTAARHRDAVRLTQLVGLEDAVTFTRGDFMHADIPGQPFDLVLCQGASMHFADVRALLRRMAGHLRPHGWLAIEDAVIVRLPSTAPGQAALEQLLHYWNGRFQLRDDWPDLLQETGFSLERMEDLTAIAIAEFETLLAQEQDPEVAAEERLGWELGLGLFRRGTLASVRILARRVA